MSDMSTPSTFSRVLIRYLIYLKCEEQIEVNPFASTKTCIHGNIKSNSETVSAQLGRKNKYDRSKYF